MYQTAQILRRNLTMKHIKVLLTVVTMSFSFGVLTALAQHGHAGGLGGGRGMEPPGGGVGAPAEPGHVNGGHETLPTMGGSKTPDQLLSQNTQLSSRLQSLLPAGTSAQAAASGFKNLGQFVAAVHVAHNLGIPFSQLKADMVGSGMSLGKAIHTLRPDVNAKKEVKLAKKQAKEDLKQSGSSNFREDIRAVADTRREICGFLFVSQLAIPKIRFLQ